MSDNSQQIIYLQETIAHLENMVDSLNKVVTKQDQELQDLNRKIQLLYNYMQNSADEAIAPFDLMADKPPHY